MSAPSEPNPYYKDPNSAPPQPNPPVPPFPQQMPPQAGWPAYPPGYAPPPRTNGLAVAAMVLGIVWIYWIGSILALIFGYRARKQIRERNEGGGGMATAGIVLGWVGVGTATLFLVGGLVSYISS